MAFLAHKSVAKIFRRLRPGYCLWQTRPNGSGSGIPRDNLDSSEPYIEDDFPQTGYAIEAPPPRFWNCTKKSINLTRLKKGRRLRPCKVFGPNLTKMFHVKHFGSLISAPLSSGKFLLPSKPWRRFGWRGRRGQARFRGRRVRRPLGDRQYEACKITLAKALTPIHRANMNLLADRSIEAL